tara:strand:+ start:351 stop:536 length:186 start_codon:yes stop_codon:yes gene_type:complete
MAKTGRKGWIISVVVERFNRDEAEMDRLACGHEVYAKWIGRGYDAPKKRRCHHAHEVEAQS